LHLDQRLEPPCSDSRSGRLGKGRTDLDAVDSAPEGGSEDQSGAAFAASDVEDVALAGEAKILTEEPNLLWTRRVLNLVIALDDFPGPRHAAQPTLRCD
jgi:hypothetical protein